MRTFTEAAFSFQKRKVDYFNNIIIIKITYIQSVLVFYIYSQTCVKQPYKTIHILAFQTGGCLLLHESSAGAFCATFIQQ